MRHRFSDHHMNEKDPADGVSPEIISTFWVIFNHTLSNSLSIIVYLEIHQRPMTTDRVDPP